MSDRKLMLEDPAAYYMQLGREQERERIIKLLEDYIPDFYELSPNSDAGKYPLEHLIELIKGEKK